MLDPKYSSAWLWYADRAYVATRVLWVARFLLDTPVHSHRTIELYLKAFLVAKGQEVRQSKIWGHDLDNLRQHAAAVDDSLDVPELNRRVAYFQRYFDLVRYPTDLEGKLEGGQTIRFAFDANIHALDQVVAYVRSRIPRDEPNIDELYSLHQKESLDSLQVRALHDTNSYLNYALADVPAPPGQVFDTDFHFDLPGC